MGDIECHDAASTLRILQHQRSAALALIAGQQLYGGRAVITRHATAIVGRTISVGGTRSIAQRVRQGRSQACFERGRATTGTQAATPGQCQQETETSSSEGGSSPLSGAR